MINIIKNIIINNKNIDGYKITEQKVEANELFLVKKSVDMDRAKDVHHFKVAIYKDLEENGINYRGEATINIYPTMTEKEIEFAVNEAVFAAQFAKNQYYPLVKKSNLYKNNNESNFSKEDLPHWINEIIKAVYKNDIYENGGINSCEIFLNKIYTRIINSEGVDVEGVNYKCMVEYIPTWMGEDEEVELYRCLNFSSFDSTSISDDVEGMLNICKDRARAVKTPNMGKIPVILTRGAVPEIFSFYTFKSNAQAIYQEESNWKVGDKILGEDVLGDVISIKVDPFMSNSTKSNFFDEDGFPLEDVTVIEDGVLKNYIASNKYAYYLNIKPTGNINNFIISGGSKTIDELKEEPYLEIAAFSDFTVDKLTGNFGGEIRLAWYFDGSKVTPVTGGSISGNIMELQKELYLSKELQRENNFIGPKAIKLMNVTIATN